MKAKKLEKRFVILREDGVSWLLDGDPQREALIVARDQNQRVLSGTALPTLLGQGWSVSTMTEFGRGDHLLVWLVREVGG